MDWGHLTFHAQAYQVADHINDIYSDDPLSLGDIRIGVLAVGAIGAGAALLGLAAVGVTFIGNADIVDIGYSHAAEGGSVIVVGVDT